MIDERPPTFWRHRRDDGSEYVTVDYWPDRVDISAAMFGLSIGDAYIRRRGGEVTIKVLNGEATYRIEGYDRYRDLYHAVAVRRQWVGERP